MRASNAALRALAAAAMLCAFAACGSARGSRADGPVFDLGRAPSASSLDAAQPAIRPDGAGLPAGHGSVAQGQAIYETRCANCHDTPAFPQLWGGVGSLSKLPDKTVGSYWPYATTLFDYIDRAMPPDAPKTLSPDDVYAVSAYILSQSGIVPKDAVLDRTSLPHVKMPNRDRFFANDGTPDT